MSRRFRILIKTSNQNVQPFNYGVIMSGRYHSKHYQLSYSMVFGTYSHKIVVLFIAVLKQVHEVRGICNTESLYPANFCYNGDFELPNIGTANWQVATPGNLTGWTSTQSEIGKGSYYNPRWGATQVVELATNNQNTKYNQTLTLTVGHEYKLELQCAAKQNVALNTSGFRILWNDVFIQNIKFCFKLLFSHLQQSLLFFKIFILSLIQNFHLTHVVILDQSTPVDYQIHSYSLRIIPTQVSNKLTLEARGRVDNEGTTCDNIKFRQVQTDYHVVEVNGVCLCQAGYYAAPPSPQCLPCSNVDSQCLRCSNETNASLVYDFTCSSCNVGYYPSGPTCTPCSAIHPNCLKCSAGAICTECNAAGHWVIRNSSCACAVGFFDSSGVCLVCTTLDLSCLTCQQISGVAECLTCLTGFFPENTACLPCTTNLVGCMDCYVNGSTCIVCDNPNNWELVSGQCLCVTGYYLNISTTLCEPCADLDQFCILCNQSMGVYQCLQCSWGYFLAGDTCVPCFNALTACLNCSQDGTVCYACNETTDFFLDSYNTTITVYTTCVLCSLAECLDCDSLWDCNTCNEVDNFFLNVTTQLCELCTLEACLNCSSLYLCYECDRDLNYLLNDVTLQCHVCTLEGCIRCSSNQTCELCGKGYKSQPNADLLCDRIYGCSDLMDTSQSTSSSSVPAIQYTLEECQNAENYKTMADVVGYASYGLLLLSIFTGKIVGLQLFGVLQLAYFNLADHDFVNLYLSPFLNWRFMNGFNFGPNMLTTTQSRRNLRTTNKLGTVSGNQMVSSSTNNVVPDNIKAIGYTHSFIENMNVMLLIMLAEYVLSILMIIFSCKCKNLRKFGYFLLKQVFLTIFIFNCFNITFSAGLHFKYATAENTEDYQLSSVAAVLAIAFCLVAIISLQLLNHDGYGEFKKKFKINCVTRAYITISILYRMALGFYMALGNEQQYQSLLILAISLAYLMFNIINLPFIDAYQNYRANLCHVTQLVILFVFNFYSSMKANESLEVKSRRFTPALLQIGMVVFCIIVSAICLFYESYKFIKSKCQDKKVKNQKQKVMDKSEMHIQKTDANEELYEENS